MWCIFFPFLYCLWLKWDYTFVSVVMGALRYTISRLSVSFFFLSGIWFQQVKYAFTWGHIGRHLVTSHSFGWFLSAWRANHALFQPRKDSLTVVVGCGTHGASICQRFEPCISRSLVKDFSMVGWIMWSKGQHIFMRSIAHKSKCISIYINDEKWDILGVAQTE